MRKLMLTALLTAIAVPPTSAAARPQRSEQSWNDRQRDHDEPANAHEDHRDQRRYGRNGNWHRHDDRQRQEAWQEYHRYDYNRPDARYGNYQADRYYRDGRNYPQRRLVNDDRIYRGSNGRYYCRRSDGTTGLIIGAIGGGILGNVIAPRGSKTLGAILGGGGGALIGRSIDRGGVRCN